MLEVDFCGLTMRNPIVLASGIMGVTKSCLQRIAQMGAGALTTKSISKHARKGHRTPVVLSFESGIINAVGYTNPGWREAQTEFAGIKQIGVPVFASIIGEDAEEFAYMAKHFPGSEFSAVEISLSCPHTPGFGLLAGQGSARVVYEITDAVRKQTALPIIVKLSPSLPDLVDVGIAAQEAGANALNMGNTHGPGMIINIETARPVLGNTFGGISGPAVYAITLRCVYDLYAAVDIPIIGTGGVTKWQEAAAMIMAGARIVGVGSALYYSGLGVFSRICSGLENFMREHNYTRIGEMVGKAHET